MKLHLLICLLLVPFAAVSQKQYNTWAFGDGSGLDFNRMIPITTSINSNEGCASISDPETGQLLFYTDGVLAWNRNHEVMDGLGQSSLQGNTDAIQSTLIVRQPGSYRFFHLYTNSGSYVGYYIVDMQGDNGLGSIASGFWAVTSVKASTEGLAGVMHCNGEEVWIVIEEYGTNKLVAQLLKKGGLQGPPIKSELSNTPGGKAAHIAFSPNGNMMVISRGDGKHIYKFNNSTGKVEGLLAVVRHGYGACFSPDGQLLYVPGYDNQLYQYDLRTINSSTGLAEYAVGSNPGGLASMAIGPDGRGYLTSFGYDNFLAIVNYPNVIGKNCEFMPKSISLLGRSIFGLPNMVAGDIITGKSKPELKVSHTCFDDTTRFEIFSQGSLDSVKWDINGISGPGYNGNGLKFGLVLEPGEYKLKLKTYHPCRTDSIDSVLVIPGRIPNLRIDTTICAGGLVYLNADVHREAAYSWSTGETTPVIAVNEPGQYLINIQSGNCHITGLFIVEKAPDIWIALGQEYFICDDENELAKLDAGKGFDRYLWYPTGDTTQWIIVENTGEYYVIVEDFRGCKGQGGTVVRRRCPGYLYFPTGFSPNGDQLNDVFKPAGQDIVSYELSIYNRWGEQIFQSTEIDAGWDGSFKNKPSPEESYIWIAEYSYYDKDKFIRNSYEKGTVQLVR